MTGLGNNTMNYFARNIRQPVPATQVFKNQFFMIQAQLMQNSGLKIVHMHRIFDDIVAKLVGFAIHNSWFNTTARHPDPEAARMMIASIIIFGQFALTIVGTAKFTAPDHQCFIQQPPLFQIGNQRGRSLIDIFCLFAISYGRLPC